jgi:hypothetical protein
MTDLLVVSARKKQAAMTKGNRGSLEESAASHHPRSKRRPHTHDGNLHHVTSTKLRHQIAEKTQAKEDSLQRVEASHTFPEWLRLVKHAENAKKKRSGSSLMDGIRGLDLFFK